MAVELSKLRLNCQSCNDAQKIFRGCNGNGKLTFKYEDKVIDVCPRRLVTHQTSEYVQQYYWFKRKMLPFPGSWMQHPAKLIDIFTILESKEIDMQDKDDYSNLR